MNTNALSKTAETPENNIVALAIQPRPKPQSRKSRFKIIPFINPSGEKVWCVSGYKLDGTRIRENYQDENKARCRQIELESEYLRQPSQSTIRATKLSENQLLVAETAIRRLGDDWEKLPDIVDHWKRTGIKSVSGESPRIDDAVDQYLVWMKASDFRNATKRHWRNRMNVFKNSVPNGRVSDVTPDDIWAFLETRNITAAGKDTYRRCVSRFFSWCVERPRRWTNLNPCHGVKIKQANKSEPEILSIADCKALLQAAETHKGGMLAPYTALCLFGGLRPSETARMTWEQVNFKDGEIRLSEDQTKTKKSRVLKICPTLAAWLKAHKGKAFYPANWRKEFDALKAMAGYGTPTKEQPDLKPWPSDVLRHTAISHYFRNSGSYGFTAEQFGNSEAIIKNHYQGRVSTKETKEFYRIMPGKGGVK